MPTSSVPAAAWGSQLARALPRTPSQLRCAARALVTAKAGGWLASAAGHPVDGAGDAVPWLTYPAIGYLGAVLTGTRVLEFGSGGSTSWLAARCLEIRSLENDPKWVQRVGQPPNGEVVLVDSDPDEYLRQARVGAPWDVVIIDGVNRLACAAAATDLIVAGGLVVLDDTDLEQCLPLITTLEAAGLGRIDFWGPRPGMGVASATSVFSADLQRWSCIGPPATAVPGLHGRQIADLGVGSW